MPTSKFSPLTKSEVTSDPSPPSTRENPREIDFRRHPQASRPVTFCSRKSDCLHLLVGQSLLFTKRFSCASVPVQDALVQRANPQIHFIPREHLHVEIPQTGVQRPDLFPVVEKHAALFCADQQMSQRHREDRRDRSRLGICGINLTETFSIEDQDAFSRRGHDEFRLGRISRRTYGHGDQRGRRQFPSRRKLPLHRSAQIVFGKPQRPRDIEMVLKARKLEENIGRADNFKVHVSRR